MEFYKNARIILLGMALAFSSNLYGLDNKTEILLNIQKNPFVTPCIKIEKLHATDQCSHCHQAFRAGERVTIINECQHLIHTNCIQLIGGEDKTCPHEGCNKLIIKHNYATCLDHMINRPDQYAQFNDLLSTIIKNNRASFPEYSSFLVVSNESNKEHVAPYRNILFKKEALSLLLSSFKNILYYFAKTFPIFYLIDTAKLNINIEFQSIKEISKSQFFRDSGQFDKDIHTSSMDTNFDKFLDIEKVKYMVFDNIFYSMLFHLISIEMIVNHITYREMLRNGINVTGKTIDGVANIYRFLSGRPRINGRHFLNTENLSLQEKDKLVNLLKDFLENYIIGYGLSKAFFFPFIIGMHSGAEMLWAPMINNYYLNNPFTTSAGVYALGKSIWHNFNELRKRNENTGELQIWSTIKKFVSGGNRPQENITPQEDEQTQQTNPRPSLWNRFTNYFRR